MTKPQTDREELQELAALDRKHSDEIGRRTEVRQVDETVALTPDELAARKRRNVWIALAVAAFIVLVFAITLTQMQAAVLDRPL